MKPCCIANRKEVLRTSDRIVELCQVCGCKHYYVNVESGLYIMKGA